MKAEPKRVPAQVAKSIPQAAPLLMPISYWKSAAIGVTAYVFEASESAIRQSGWVPEWVGYPDETPGSGIAVPAHHLFPSYLKLLRLKSGRLRLVIDARAVLRGDTPFQHFLCNLQADTQLSLVKGEPV
jgi:hypothetical protein